jgi:hypothetical protein
MPSVLAARSAKAHDLERVGNRDVPAGALKGLVDPAGPVHRLDAPGDLVPMASDAVAERAWGIGIGPHRGHLDRPAGLIEHVQIQVLT